MSDIINIDMDDDYKSDEMNITFDDINQTYDFYGGVVHVDERGRVFKDGKQVNHLTPTERMVLALLAKNPHQAVSADTILDLWTYHLSTPESVHYRGAIEAPLEKSASKYIYILGDKLGKSSITRLRAQGFMLNSDQTRATPSNNTWYRITRGDDVWHYNSNRRLLIGAVGYIYLPKQPMAILHNAFNIDHQTNNMALGTLQVQIVNINKSFYVCARDTTDPTQKFKPLIRSRDGSAYKTDGMQLSRPDSAPIYDLSTLIKFTAASLQENIKTPSLQSRKMSAITKAFKNAVALPDNYYPQKQPQDTGYQITYGDVVMQLFESRDHRAKLSAYALALLCAAHEASKNNDKLYYIPANSMARHTGYSSDLASLSTATNNRLKQAWQEARQPESKRPYIGVSTTHKGVILLKV